jgi:predicted DNA-binding transcriptional regulator AlpA
MTKTATSSGWLSCTKVAEFLGVSTMTIFRWQRDDKLDFPQPRVINTRKYWNRDAVETWMRRTATNKANKRA